MKIRVFQTKSKDGKYTFIKYKDGDEYITVKLKGNLRPNAFPCMLDIKEDIKPEGETFKTLTASDYDIYYEYYNCERKEVVEIRV